FTTRLLLNTIAKTEMYTLSLHDALPIYAVIYYQRDNFLEGSERYDIIFDVASNLRFKDCTRVLTETGKYLVIGHDHYGTCGGRRSEEHTSELQSRENLVCRLLLEKKKKV